MDPLSDLLRAVRLDGAHFYAVEARGPWRVETAAAKELTPRIMPAAEHLISYHIVTAGQCCGGVLGEEQVELSAGDVIVFPHGDAHVMASAGATARSRHVHISTPSRYRETVYLGDRGEPDASFICGFLGCDRGPFNPLLAGLPRRVHVRRMSEVWIGGFTRQLTEESRLGQAGSDSILIRLAEAMFIEVLRRYMRELPPEQTGWLAGLRDEVVGRVLTLIHERPGHPWTLAGLAREAASSRTTVAQRFAVLVGQPPMQYLAQWRMQVAAHLLCQGRAKVAAVGAQVGYDSEAAFSRAFKKAAGLAPGAWRDRLRTGEQDVGTGSHGSPISP
jgi:AraC-like DNA-binding protein